ncbi:MAG TPA: dTDP-4-dehydrorhamnose 3,5-epimerase [Thermoanaerobaculia bacterium]|jgi:dTDP-4-dehydrorhamnose 3,5-epimerase|nr:dTDP-4-dehydrorhamnose 3,5-epimerase [Thermoanaerobaculia bacterium]
MKFLPTALKGVILVEPRVFQDDRGFFLETYHQQKYAKGGIPHLFVQDNHSYSIHWTLRGLHAQLRHPQGKLVRAVQGEIFDVAVDIRPDSPTVGQWVGERLSDENFRQLWIPPGFAHGFCVLSDTAHVLYKCTDFYRGDDEIGIAWNDPAIGIDWPLPPDTEPLLSPKDRDAPALEAILQILRGHG